MRAVAVAIGRDPGATARALRRLARAGIVHIERLGPRKCLAGLNRAAVGHDALRALAAACSPVADAAAPVRHRLFPDRRRCRGAASPMDLDALFGSRLAGRALLFVRALGGADIAELADLLGEARRPVVRRALRRFVALGVVRVAPRTGLRRPYVLDPAWPGAAPLARLLDLHLDALPQVRRRAAASLRAAGGRRGPRAARAARARTPRGLDAAAAFAPFLPPSQARVVALIARHGPVGTIGIANALGVRRGTALALGTALVKRGLATTAAAPFELGVERWYAFTAAGAAVGGYLGAIIGPVRGPRRGGKPPSFPATPPRQWRECVGTPGTPQRNALRILDSLAGGRLALHALARRVGLQARKVGPHLDALIRVGILAADAPGNVAMYGFDHRTPQGRGAHALFAAR